MRDLMCQTNLVETIKQPDAIRVAKLPVFGTRIDAAFIMLFFDAFSVFVTPVLLVLTFARLLLDGADL